MTVPGRSGRETEPDTPDPLPASPPGPAGDSAADTTTFPARTLLHSGPRPTTVGAACGASAPHHPCQAYGTDALRSLDEEDVQIRSPTDPVPKGPRQPPGPARRTPA
ncbi:hypothetical protein GCM10022630_32790 [Thermobifida alba]